MVNNVVKNIVALVGAGASSSLGTNDQPIPLMTAWANSLRVDLGEPFATALGLSGDVSAQTFEHQLGLFLEFHRTIDDYRAFAHIVQEPGLAAPAQAWIDHTSGPRNQILDILRHNLFRNFGPTRVSPDRARRAYEQLVQLFGSTSVDGMTFATTNYDVAIERGLETTGKQVVDGFEYNAYSPAPFNADLLSQVDNERNCYVLHLHGATGWFRTESGVLRYPTSQYLGGIGEPAVLFPDDQKKANSLLGMSAIWTAFTSALERATHLIAIGHSLNDQHITAHIRQNLSSRALVMVTGLADQVGELTDRSGKMLGREVVGAALTFGPNLEGDLSQFRKFFSSEPTGS